MILHGINDNVLISHSSYSGIYQYVAKNESSTKRETFAWGWNQTKTPTKLWCKLLMKYPTYENNPPHFILKGGRV